ncbi:uncharacterized protein PFLUO_LOCUS4664 [Penicillium psychrofluorescens]|uniref:uncharacterized protein n=1 Tax=Penicillium psychrofluorescens TaxID=3158075 RepID=UPI003CCDD69D
MGFAQEVANFPREIGKAFKLNRKQALVFLTCWWCWTLGSMNFYLLPYTQPEVAKALGVETAKIAEANTTTMLSRSIGAAIFGILSDQHGRKIPLVVDLVLMGVFTLCSGFVHTYGQFVAVRFLFGITYGALYGVTMAAVLEAVPREARGVVAGFTQQGFGAGNMIASGLHLAMENYEWQSLYYVGAGLTLTAIGLRIICPDYSVVTEAIRENEDIVQVPGNGPETMCVTGTTLPFWIKFRYAIKHHWPIFVYCTVLTACFNTLGHGHMDVYPSFLETQRGLSIRHETYVTVVLQCGGILGGVVGGYLARYGPKWVPFGFAIALAPLLPALILPTKWQYLAAGSFFFEFSYGAAIGTVGNILQMVCPHPGIRAAFGGVTYNLGNAISSVSPTIETKLGDDLPLKSGVPDYGRIILILVGITIGLLSLTLACMPTKNVNLEWDQEDPNQTIPAHEAPAKIIEHDQDHIERVHDIETGAISKRGDQGDVEHVEMSPSQK